MYQILKEFYLYYFLTINVRWRSLLLAGIILILVMMFILYRKKAISKKCSICAVMLNIWILFVFISTVLGRAQLYDTPQYNINPLWEYEGILFSESNYVKLVYARGVGYNILMLMPIGLLLPIVICRKNIWICITVAAIISLSIEVLQLITMRGLFEICDILNNIIGTVIGYWIYEMIGRIYRYNSRSKKVGYK